MSVSPLCASVPQKINYQGNLRESGVLVTGTKSMVFRLYASSTSAGPLWTSPTYSVSVATGVYRVVLEPSGVDWEGTNPWLEMEVNGTKLSPREELTTSPYSLNAMLHSGKKYTNAAASPASQAEGDLWFDTNAKVLKVWSGSTWDSLGGSGGGVLSVTGTAPIASSGGTTPDISIAPATTLAAGSISASDKAKLDASTNLNTPNKLVLRDGSGNFSAGTITASLIGNASTVTNGIYTTGSYGDPAWITFLAGFKISGNIPGRAANVTGVVADANLDDNLSINNARLFAPAGAGNVGIGTTNPSDKLTLDGGWLKFNTSGMGVNWADGTTSTTAATGGGGGMGGTGTVGKLAKFTGASAVGDSVVTESGGNIGIGTASPGIAAGTFGRILDIEASNNPAIVLSNTGVGGREFAWYSTIDGGVGKLMLWDGTFPGGLNRLTVDNTGNVGINLASPETALDIAGGGLTLRSTGPIVGSAGRARIWHDGANLVGRQESGGVFDLLSGWRISGSNIILHPNMTGNVGIGTTGPGARLDIQETSATSPYSLRVGTSTAAGGYHVVVSTTGNVGIGTTNPRTKLHIVSTGLVPSIDPTGTIITDAIALSGVAPAIQFHNGINQRGGLGVASSPGHYGVENNPGDMSLFSQTGNLNFGTSSTLVNPNVRMTITPTGNLGIGTTSPQQTLEVNGGIRANTTIAQPACSAATRGTFWVVQGGAGVKDNVQVCAKDPADSYAWRVIY